jgi:hypothetical protein
VPVGKGWSIDQALEGELSFGRGVAAKPATALGPAAADQALAEELSLDPVVATKSATGLSPAESKAS